MSNAIDLHHADVALLGPFEVITPIASGPYRVVCTNDDRREIASCQMRKDAYIICAILNDVYNRTPRRVAGAN